MRYLLVLAALAVMVYESQVTAWRPECECTDDYSPVCGRDFRTYPNDCHLKCAKTLKSYDGVCVRKGTAIRKEPPRL